jgi:hypothetical protein
VWAEFRFVYQTIFNVAARPQIADEMPGSELNVPNVPAESDDFATHVPTTHVGWIAEAISRLACRPYTSAPPPADMQLQVINGHG